MGGWRAASNWSWRRQVHESALIRRFIVGAGLRLAGCRPRADRGSTAGQRDVSYVTSIVLRVETIRLPRWQRCGPAAGRSWCM